MAVKPSGRHPLNNQPEIKPATRPGGGAQQVQGRDVQTRNGQTGVIGRGGNFQPLGAAAQRGLQSGQPAQAPAPARTPPMWDPSTLKPGAGGGGAGGGPIGYTGPNGSGVVPPGINSYGGGPASWQINGLTDLGDGAQPIDFSGRPVQWNTPGQQLGVQAPGSDAGNIDNALSSLRQQLGIGTNPSPQQLQQAVAHPLVQQGLRQLTGAPANIPTTNPPPGGGFGGAPGAPGLMQMNGSPANVPLGKPLPNNGAAGIAAGPGGTGANPYLDLLRSRIMNKPQPQPQMPTGAGAGAGGLDPGNRVAAGLRGY